MLAAHVWADQAWKILTGEFCPLRGVANYRALIPGSKMPLAFRGAQHSSSEVDDESLNFPIGPFVTGSEVGAISTGGSIGWLAVNFAAPLAELQDGVPLLTTLPKLACLPVHTLH